jgi:hypothetical protein
MRRAGDYYGPDGHIFYIAMRLPNLRDNTEEIIKETVGRDLYNMFLSLLCLGSFSLFVQLFSN